MSSNKINNKVDTSNQIDKCKLSSSIIIPMNKKYRVSCTTSSTNASQASSDNTFNTSRASSVIVGVHKPAGEHKSSSHDCSKSSSSSTVAVRGGEKGAGIMDEFDALFAKKKETKKAAIKEEEDENKRRKLQQTSNSSNSNNESNNGYKRIKMSGDRADVECLKSGEWADDGLGGKFNSDGFTGRREETSGLKVYKTHLFNKKGNGTSKDCPFDCNCCFI